MDTCLCLGCFFLLAGFVTDVISTASREWVVNADGETSGLWTVCFKSGQCMSMSKQDKLYGVRAMMVLSVVISGITMIVVILDIASIWINRATNRWVLSVVTILTMLSVLLTLASVLVSQIIDWDITNTEYNYSYWLAVASVIIFFIAGIFFLASAIIYHREQKRCKGQASQSAIKKDYPFTIPYYNYKDRQSHENELATSDNEMRNKSKKPGNNPFLYDYRYYPTSPLPFGAYRNDDTGVINPGFWDSHNNSTGVNTTQLPSHQNRVADKIAIDNYQGSVYSKPHLTGTATNMASATENTMAGSMIASRVNTQSLYGRSTASSRVPRDFLGYPLNYSQEL